MSQTRHEEIWELLPWHVNDTLDADERSRVEEHLVSCPICREEERALMVLAETVADSAATEDDGLSRLFERIEAEEAEEAEEAAGNGSSFRRLPKPVWGALAAQFLLILGLGGWILGISRPVVDRAPDGAFRTLANPPAAGAEVSDVRPAVRMVFEGSVSLDQVRALLAASGGEIVAGPSPRGVFTVRLEASSEDLPATLEALRAAPGVLFVEPASYSGSP